MTTPRSSTRYKRAVDAADAQRRPLLNRHVHRRRQRPAQRGIRDPRRVQHHAAPLLEIDGEDAPAAQAVEQREHFPVRQPLVSADDDAIDVKHLQSNDNRDRAMGRIERETGTNGPGRRPPPPEAPT